jgi:hypothetical protein
MAKSFYFCFKLFQKGQNRLIYLFKEQIATLGGGDDKGGGQNSHSRQHLTHILAAGNVASQNIFFESKKKTFC